MTLVREMTNHQSRDPSARAPLVPLATLIGRELRGEKSERPSLRYGHAGLAKRGEDLFLIKPDCLRIPGNPSTAFSVFAVWSLSFFLHLYIFFCSLC